MKTPPTTHPKCLRFIINVSSPEGSFSASSDGFSEMSQSSTADESVHPHTNMAKAALNRLTQTIAPECLKSGISVVAVDPGWVSLMHPKGDVGGNGGSTNNVGGDGGAAGEWEKRMRKGMRPPLSVEDGAARVLDPVLRGLGGGEVWSGVLLRDFRVVGW